MVDIYEPRPQRTASQADDSDTPADSIIIIGSGPVGMRLIKDLFRKSPQAHVTLFGNEPFQPYNRVQLSAFLAGDLNRDDLDIPLPSNQSSPNFSFIIASIQSIDTANKRVKDANGNEHLYDQLVLAVGARAHQPNIPGIDQTGVYTFRNLKDTESLYARVARSRHTVVMGGGLLGLEAAKALLRHSTQVTLVQQGSRLMNRQLDEQAAKLLQQKVEQLGIRVVTESGVREIYGDGNVTGVRTFSGEHIECDTVLVCAGIKPNVELARAAGLNVATGILVDDQLHTSDPSIFAIGECCEHRGLTYGLVSPGYEQAAVAADVLAGGTSSYQGSLFVSRLKVVGQQVYSMGEVNDLPQRPLQSEWRFQKSPSGIYRKLVLHRGRIIGAVGFGDWPELSRVQEHFQGGRYLWPWQRLFFALSGRLWASQVSERVSQWRDDAIVCQCNSITKGDLDIAMSNGSSTALALQHQTGAGSVCGTCKPLLEELVGSTSPAGKELAWGPVLGVSLIALFTVLYFLLSPAAEVSKTFLDIGWFEQLWNDKYWKQVTGFTILGLSIASLLMSLRKRLKYSWLGNFGYWRLMHISVGAICAALLIFHTGFHLGANLNRFLMINFLAIVVLGSLTGSIVSLSHKLSPQRARSLRKFWSWSHIVVTWPLPALLAVHIFTVYYF